MRFRFSWTQETRWDEGGNEAADDHTIFYVREYLKHKINELKIKSKNKTLEACTKA
jgi:hypothetical protein